MDDDIHIAGQLSVNDHPDQLSGTLPGAVSNPADQQPPARRILVVEDDVTLAALEAEVLAAHGYFVVWVPSGEMAITTFQRTIPDLVVLDLELTSEVDGLEVLQALRLVSPIPVLITTSAITTIRAYLHRCEETRLTLDLLPKPYRMQTLLRRVKRMLPIIPTSQVSEA